MNELEARLRICAARAVLVRLDAHRSGGHSNAPPAITSVEGDRIRIGEHWVELRVEGEHLVAWGHG